MIKYYKHIALVAFFSLISCGSSPLKQEDYKYYNPNFKLSKKSELKTDGIYLSKKGENAYRALSFCSNSLYTEQYGNNFDTVQLENIKWRMDGLCNSKNNNYFYKIDRNEIKLMHSTRFRGFVYETARISGDTLYYKEETSDWTQKKAENPYIFIPFNK